MAGAKRKSPNALAGHRTHGTMLQLVPRSEPPPPASKGWWKATKDDWIAFWTSGVASQVDTRADLPALREIFEAMDELRRLQKAFKAAPMIAGSMGQMRLNPVAPRIDVLRNYLLTAGARFGLDPLSRLRLGWTLAEGLSAEARLHKMMNSPRDPDDDADVVDADEWEAP